MATPNRNSLKAGLFILLSCAAVAAVLVALGGLERFLTPHESHTVVFRLTDDVGGLRVGDEVRLGGVKVGSVRSIEITQPPAMSSTRPTTSPAAQPRIVVTFDMPGKYVLRQDPGVAVQTQLTGGAMLNIDSLGVGPPLAAEAPIVGRPSFIASLSSTLSETAPELRDMVTEMKTTTLPKLDATVTSIKTTADAATRLVAHVNEQVDPIVGKYNVVADRAAEALVQVRDLVGDTKTDFRTSVANVRQGTENLKQTTAAINEKLPPMLAQADAFLTKVNKAVDAANDALADIKLTVANAKELSAAAKSVVVGNRSKLDTMIGSLKTSADNLKAATAEIRRSPWRLLYKPAAGEMANLNLYDAARQFSDGAEQLSDAAGALRDAMKDSTADKTRIDNLLRQLDKSFGNFTDVEQKLWKSVKE